MPTGRDVVELLFVHSTAQHSASLRAISARQPHALVRQRYDLRPGPEPLGGTSIVSTTMPSSMGVVEGREGDATCIALTRIWLCASSDTPSSRASDSPPACQMSPETNSPDAVESLDQ